MKMKIEIWILMILLIPGVLAITGTRSLTTEMQPYNYMCDDGRYQIVMNPTAGYSMIEILSQNWRFSSLEGDALWPECKIQDPPQDNEVRCGLPTASGTRTLIFNVLNYPGTFNNVFSNVLPGDTATGLPIVEVKANQCVPDSDGDKYPSSPISNVCGCDSSVIADNSKIDCCDTGVEPSLGCDSTTAASMYPGATEIAGDGIDQDCNGKDTALPSIISRILPETAQQGVEFGVILDVQHIGEEPNLVIDERFDPSYFDCGSAPSNNGQCNIINNIGKVRWVITTPISFQLKYYLVPKSTQLCYNFDIGVSGTYLFEGRSERNIPGDYIIGDMSCVSCIPSGTEMCGNDVDEDCDGHICPSEKCNPGFYFDGSKCLNCGGIRMCANGPITYCSVDDGICPETYGADCSNHPDCIDPNC